MAVSPTAPAVTHPSPPVVATPPVPASPPPVAPPPAAEARTGHPLAIAFRNLDKAWSFAHTAAFGAVGLVIFLLAGLRRAWLPVTGLAVLSEVIPNLQRQEFHADDAEDFAANLLGVLLAAATVAVVEFFQRRKKHVE